MVLHQWLCLILKFLEGQVVELELEVEVEDCLGDAGSVLVKLDNVSVQ